MGEEEWGMLPSPERERVDTEKRNYLHLVQAHTYMIAETRWLKRKAVRKHELRETDSGAGLREALQLLRNSQFSILGRPPSPSLLSAASSLSSVSSSEASEEDSLSESPLMYSLASKNSEMLSRDKEADILARD